MSESQNTPDARSATKEESIDSFFSNYEIEERLKKLFSFLSTLEKTAPIKIEQIFWNNKPIRDKSVLLWDLENIPFNRFSDIKQVVKYTPQACYIITKQPLSYKKRRKIINAGFRILDAHKTISDTKIITMMKLHKEKKEMILISADADFAKEANRYIKQNHLHWIVTDANKKRVVMYVNLASANLTISSLPKREKQVQVTRKKQSKHFKKVQVGKKVHNSYRVQAYMPYYKGFFKRVFTKFKSFFSIEQELIAPKSSPTPAPTPKIKQIKQDPIVKEYGLHVNEQTGVNYRYILRLNAKRQMTICGKVQKNPDGEILLQLYKNLKNKYEMPSFKKLIRSYDTRILGEYVSYESLRDIYLLNEFERIDVKIDGTKK